MMRETLVFGPIRSRRLGSSLGINLLPEEGKLCNFDCIYCECGWNRDGRGDHRIPTAEELRKALSEKLEECREKGIQIDSITFSGVHGIVGRVNSNGTIANINTIGFNAFIRS